ncbi:MAG: undecaprenyl diphosphate synthase family protein [Candidatus Diapherotrites archaeon]
MRHVLYMPDGNNRFARERKLPLEKAYLEGGKTLKRLVEFFILKKGFKEATYFAMAQHTFSRDNERSEPSLPPIFDAVRKTLQQLYEERFFQQNGLCFRLFLNGEKVPARALEYGRKLESETRENEKGIVNVLLGYSLEGDFSQALKKSDEKSFSQLRKNLSFSEIDLVLRNREMRLSNGPVYAMGQAQMIVIPKYNPEVTEKDFAKAFAEYEKLRSYRAKTNPMHRI